MRRNAVRSARRDRVGAKTEARRSQPARKASAKGVDAGVVDSGGRSAQESMGNVGGAVGPQPSSEGGSPSRYRDFESLFVLLLTVVFMWLSVRLVAALRRRAVVTSPVARRLHQLERVLRVLLVGLLAWSAWRVVNPRPEVAPWLILGLFVTFLWAARNLLVDIATGLILRAEGALVMGRVVELSGQPAGVIEHIGFRGLRLRDDRSRRWSVPYRSLAKVPFVRSQPSASRHQIRLRVVANSSTEIRHAVLEAVATAPYVRVGAPVHIERDPLEPSEWTVDVALIDRRFFPALEGELADRVERMLSARGTGSVSEPDPVPAGTRVA